MRAPPARHRPVLPLVLLWLAPLWSLSCDPKAKEVAPPCDPAGCPTPSACQRAICSAEGQCAVAASEDGITCDDGQACTSSDACDAGQCKGVEVCACREQADCAASEDGDLCNGTLYCDQASIPWSCKVNPATVISCSAGKPPACQVKGCHPGTGKCALQPVADGTPCDDGEVCTSSDVCVKGSCKGAEAGCECLQDADCAQRDDQDACNGVLYCDHSAPPWTCQVNPASVVQCGSKEDTICSHNTCEPATGECALLPVTDGTPCPSDDLSCTVEQCKGGDCYLDDSACGCSTDADCADPADDNLCDGSLYCHLPTAACRINPTTLIHCPETFNEVCRTNTCKPKDGGCQLLDHGDGDSCDDGLACTSGGLCKGGACLPSKSNCGCKVDADCAAYDDANLCNGQPYCHKSAGECRINPATRVDCPPTGDGPCLRTVCAPATGKCGTAPRPDGTPCEADHSWCTHPDSCQAGVCVAGSMICPCTTAADCLKIDDGDACNGTLYCDKAVGNCAVNPATVVTCAAGFDTACAAETCAPATGKCAAKQAIDGTPCEADGWGCTIDQCTSGACAVVQQVCACTDNADCAAFDDGESCNGALYCHKGTPLWTCQTNPATVGLCAAQGPCLKGQCDAKDQCVQVPLADGLPCDDGDLCTGLDGCSGGVCGGVATKCDDGNACTVDSCAPDKGCQHVPGGMWCAPADPCKLGICSAGACKVSGDRFWFAKAGDANATDVALAATLTDEAVVVTGSVDDGGADGMDAFVRAWRLDNKALYSESFGGAGGQIGRSLIAVPGGFALAGSHDGGDANGVDGWLAATDDVGKPAWQATFGGVGEDTIDEVARVGLGLFGAGWTASLGGCTGKCGWLLVTDAAGKNPTHLALSGPDPPAGDTKAALHAATSLSTGGALVAGEAADKGTPGMLGWLVRVSPVGQVVWNRTYQLAGQTWHAVQDMVEDVHGGAAFTGSAGSSAALDGRKIWLLRVDAAGNKVFESSFAMAKGAEGLVVMSHAMGYAVLGRQQAPGPATDYFGTLFDVGGNPAFTPQNFPGQATEWRAGFIDPFVGSWSIGTSTVGADSQIWISHGDAWGLAYCTSCAGLATEDCDDGDPCTVQDACKDSLGKCANKALGTGALCDDGDPCTGLGACAAGTCAKGGLDICQDGNPCTKDACAPGISCTFTPVVDGAACAGGTCKAGFCAKP